ncbi:AzlD family protein [Aurantimonas sp. HBX-1]|uniref:AzlD family protein n=1 Tax=Aurantimonas sp. HBX-1 TaxID=2906072 RepID=UPI001F410B64|nr:AzlD domain-containing protein [Aurantimonas sp. HBX-1]UIJ73080.1 AzlD domain-containing protein [Aurantimonas sp. HBX-1]
MSDIWLIIPLAGLLTYLTRASGHLLLARFGRIPPRLDAALNAVPAAVLTTIVTPVLVSGGWPERVAIVICIALSLRLPLIATVAIGTAMVALARAAGF